MALVELASFFNSFEAGLAQGRLEAEGIPSFIFGMEMNPVFAGGVFNVRLMIDESDREAAERLLGGDGS
jgi:hypothetical protein